MNRYQLAKLVEWAGRLRTRKRLQKVVYMLQCAGCPLKADFCLHHYGPYSQDVAQLSDEMVRAGLLEESVGHNAIGLEYSYQLPEITKRQIAEIEAVQQGRQWAEEIAPYRGLAEKLSRADLKELEYASTIAFFHAHGADWSEAVGKACEFKKTDAVRKAESLARSVFVR